ncbi:type VI secretion system baseplate subunit TssG [Pararhizobium arenae]|uniref:type VI secretion system baseplate subunit TssG n=1 Tax=Pararhizobium arenae TaxID=1856850 RepID=UPI00094AA94A|nr:type VI secretion system baseplate subunit TssG [Pararhizobium arenae]
MNALQDLLDTIRRAPEDFDLFQALRRVEATAPESPRLGQSARPSQDPVRLGQQPSLVFSPRTIASVTEPTKGERASRWETPDRIETYSFGLFGPNGPLPLHLTEYVFSRMTNDRDETMARFADMFHHRMLSFFYRAWALSEPAVSHDRKEEDTFAESLAALAGLGMPAMRGRDRMPDLVKLHYIGRLASHTRNAEGLQAILEGYFDVPVVIREFVPSWVALPAGSISRLGHEPRTGRLGRGISIGSRVHVHHHKFRVVVGPLRLQAYQRLLPGGDALGTLRDIVRNYVGDELEFEYNLVLQRREVPALQLGGKGRLGWTMWLGRRRAASDAHDLVKAISPTSQKTATDNSPSAETAWSFA